MTTIEDGWYRSGDKLVEVKQCRVTCMEEITTRCTGWFTVALDPREWNERGTDEEIEKYDEELKSATSQLRNPFTELELLGKTYQEAYAELAGE